MQVGGEQRGLATARPPARRCRVRAPRSRRAQDLAGQRDACGRSGRSPRRKPTARRRCSHWPGVSAERCGPHRDSTKRGSSRDREAAARRAEDQREPPARIAGPPAVARAERGERARVRVDEPRADRQALRAAPWRRRLRRSARAPSGVPGIDDLGAEPGEIVRRERRRGRRCRGTPSASAARAPDSRTCRRPSRASARASPVARNDKIVGEAEESAAALANVSGFIRLSQASFGICISGDSAPPT